MSGRFRIRVAPRIGVVSSARWSSLHCCRSRRLHFTLHSFPSIHFTLDSLTSLHFTLESLASPHFTLYSLASLHFILDSLARPHFTLDSLTSLIIIIIIMLGCITCCALHACLRFAQSLLALHASPLRPADLLRLCSARFFFDAGF